MKPTGTAPPALIYILATVVIAGTGFAQPGLGRATAGSGGVEVVVTPGSAALAYKSTQSDQAAVSGAVNKTVTWNAEPATGSAVDRTGLHGARCAGHLHHRGGGRGRPDQVR